MSKLIAKILLAVTFFAGVPWLHAQSSNKVWFVTWNSQPSPSSDVSVQSIATDGSATPLVAGTASYFISQTNFPSFNSPFDIAVDAAMGKVYVLDNNVPGQPPTPEYIYSFNLTGTPAQIAASAQIIYTMPVPQADVDAYAYNPILYPYPLLSGITLDPVNHYLYFNQVDVVTSSNSYIGRLNLTSSSKSDLYSSAGGNPILQTYYTGQIPGLGQIALDATNLYIAAVNLLNGNNGVYTAPLSGSGTFSELVTLSSGDTSFTNGFISGVAVDSRDNLIYYLTYNAGALNGKYNTNQNAIWSYNPSTSSKIKIGSGYQGNPDNIALDSSNSRYYFTLGADGTGNPSPMNCQAIYTGALGSTNVPTLFYTPLLSGLDTNPFYGSVVALQGIYIQNTQFTNAAPRPTLGIQPSYNVTYTTNAGVVTVASNLVLQLSWPSSFAGYVVQENGDLLNAAGWSNYAGTLNTNGTNLVITVTPLTGNMFFRLAPP